MNPTVAIDAGEVLGIAVLVVFFLVLAAITIGWIAGLIGLITMRHRGRLDDPGFRGYREPTDPVG